MRKLLASLTILGMAALLVHGQGAGPKIEGTWLVTGGITMGKKEPPENIAKIDGKMILKNGAYEQFFMGAKVETGKYKIDASKKPATIDLDILSGDDKGKKQFGIFKLEGDVLTVAMSQAGSNVRPKNFKGTDGNDVVSFFKRGK